MKKGNLYLIELVTLNEPPYFSPAGTTWKRKQAVMTWTRETMAGKSYTLMSLGFPLTKACSVLCLELGLSSSPLPQVRFFHGLGLFNFTTISGSVSIKFAI